MENNNKINEFADITINETFVVKWVQNFYRQWGYIIEKNAFITIFICIVISLLCTTQILFTP